MELDCPQFGEKWGSGPQDIWARTAPGCISLKKKTALNLKEICDNFLSKQRRVNLTAVFAFLRNCAKHFVIDFLSLQKACLYILEIDVVWPLHQISNRNALQCWCQNNPNMKHQKKIARPDVYAVPACFRAI
jgi:hypothetical protein